MILNKKFKITKITIRPPGIFLSTQSEKFQSTTSKSFSEIICTEITTSKIFNNFVCRGSLKNSPLVDHPLATPIFNFGTILQEFYVSLCSSTHLHVKRPNKRTSMNLCMFNMLCGVGQKSVKIEGNFKSFKVACCKICESCKWFLNIVLYVMT